MSFSERVEELNQEIGATVERAVSELRRQLTERLRASSEQILRHVEELSPSLPEHFLGHEHVAPFTEEAAASARQGAFAELRDGLVAIDGAHSQAEVLTALLGAAKHFASRSAILLLRGGAVRGWGAEGFSGEGDVRSLSFQLPADGAWGHLAQGQGAVRLSAADCADLCSRLESPLPQEGVLVPLVLRDQLAAALYADRADDAGDSALGGILLLEALQTLTYVAAQAIELLPLREREATATLRLVSGDTDTVQAPLSVAASEAPTAAEIPPAAPAEVAAPAAAAVELPAAKPEPAWAIPEPESHATPAAGLHHEEPEAAAPVEEHYLEPEPETRWYESSNSTPTSEIRWHTEEELSTELPPLPPLAIPEPEAAPAWSAEPEPLAPLPPLPPLPAVEEPAPRPEETVLLQRPSFEPPAADAAPSYPRPVPAVPPVGFEAPPPAPPASVPAPAPEAERGGSGTPEVRPPSDVDGPGWAFATTRVPVAPDDAELHESAKRLARLLVSEIKLYNEEQVEEGRRNRDLYERLKEDIDRSRQMYEERVEPRVWKSTDYFYQELVRILAAGDSRALGI
ncbi:MAG TPA: hypothetical protein VMM92_05875 [Thermoanaerobaculia bacterium]|nr:hypothetical protein [Thermoanaerobaculia bacterium]